ncbi:MBL fold metallo-hydrolase [Candidatus Falkowbacteria bacterium]|nr:MAG: MBL fold metallo-hydrolase [Candidatus Falkowbacteria bacterium]
MTQSRRAKRAVVATAVFCIIITATLLAAWRLYPDTRLLEISVLDIGQGDAILLEAPNGQVILVDGGPDKKVLRRLGEELPFWERTIDVIVLTHPHEDHLAGLISVLDRYQVGAVMITGVMASSNSYKHFLEIISNKQIPLILVEQTETIAFDDVRLEILYPQSSFKARRMSNINNSSIVMKMVYKEVKLLLTGDAEEAEEKELLASGLNLEADILKAGHHGSDTSSSEPFVKAVDPELVLVSNGVENSYGHPSPRTLKRFERLGITVRRTDLEGTIHINTDGQTIYQ